jgi:hypothetical protein
MREKRGDRREGAAGTGIRIQSITRRTVHSVQYAVAGYAVAIYASASRAINCQCFNEISCDGVTEQPAVQMINADRGVSKGCPGLPVSSPSSSSRKQNPLLALDDKPRHVH